MSGKNIGKFPGKACGITEFDQPEHTIDLRQDGAATLDTVSGIRLHCEIELALRLLHEQRQFRTHQVQGAGVKDNSC